MLRGDNERHWEHGFGVAKLNLVIYKLIAGISFDGNTRYSGGYFGGYSEIFTEAQAVRSARIEVVT